MAGTVVYEPADIVETLKARLGQLVVGDYFQVFFVVLLGIVEMTVETANLGEVEVDDGFGLVVFRSDKLLIHHFGFVVVVN